MEHDIANGLPGWYNHYSAVGSWDGTANTAKVRIYDRGLLRAGQWADVVVFDPERVIDHATYEKPHQYATGIEYVMVNGKVVLDQGRHSGARPGAILYGQGRR